MPQITIDGQTYELVKEQRSGLSVYRAGDRYARVGPSEKIAQNAATHRMMERFDFPVPRVLSSGTLEGQDYIVEQSLGEKTFRILFGEDVERGGSISNERFAEFLRISKHYLEAQTKAIVPTDSASFAEGIHLDIIRTELPQYAISLKDKFDRICERLSVFPYVLTHGDFNPANIFPLGVIDLEDTFSAPFGFDAVSAIATVAWFPDSPEYEFYARYRFSQTQKEAYAAMCDAVSIAAGYPAISPYYADFEFCRAVWSCVRMHEWPKLQAWRYDAFVKTYLFY